MAFTFGFGFELNNNRFEFVEVVWVDFEIVDDDDTFGVEFGFGFVESIQKKNSVERVHFIANLLRVKFRLNLLKNESIFLFQKPFHIFRNSLLIRSPQASKKLKPIYF